MPMFLKSDFNRLAKRWGVFIAIFSLTGCVTGTWGEQGLRDFNAGFGATYQVAPLFKIDPISGNHYRIVVHQGQVYISPGSTRFGMLFQAGKLAATRHCQQSGMEAENFQAEKHGDRGWVHLTGEFLCEPSVQKIANTEDNEPSGKHEEHIGPEGEAGGLDGVTKPTTGWCGKPNGYVTKMRTAKCSELGGKSFSSISSARKYAASQAGSRSAPRLATAPIEKRPLKISSSGTAFFVSRSGSLITNDHVVRRCDKLSLKIGGRTIDEVDIKGRDENSDLALLKANFQPSEIAYFRDKGAVRSGDDIIALGYPLHGLLGSQLKVSEGIVSATVGLLDDISRLQISAPIQPGNSGGPLLDEYGNVAGVVVAKLKALAIVRATGDIPQNVNFAIKDHFVKALMTSFDVEFETKGPTRLERLSDIVQRAKRYTALVQCWT